MECWVPKQGKKGHWSSFLKELLKNIQKLRFWFQIFGTPWDKKNKSENFTYEVLGIKIG